VLVGLDRLGVVVDDARVAGEDEIALLRRQGAAQLDAAARRALGLFVVAQARVALAEPRIGERELLVALGRGLKRLLRVGMLPLPGELQPFVVMPQRVERLRR